MRVFVPFAAIAIALAGCIAPGSTLDPSPAADAAFDDLASSAQDVETNGDGSIALTFTGTSQGGVGAVGFQRTVAEGALGTLDVDARVGYVEVSTPTFGDPGIALRDEEGRVLCVAVFDAPCTSPVPGSLGSAVTWSVNEYPTTGPVLPGVTLEALVTLHPPSHMVRGDPLAGVDPTIVFRVSDTGYDGAEDNIGVLGDGTIFTQKDLATLKSTDDGETWMDVAPPLNSAQSLDPMLFVDPSRGYVFVDHLYVACSQLSWSTDAGATWLQNPAACGRPGNDHQKIASGPNELPLPVPAVYYSYSIPGVWASRSMDGGLSFTSSPVAGVGDGRDPNNTGPIWADESGNVYVPMYMCDGEGYMGVGVSHDFGLTWKFVEAADVPGPCYDVDPGFWGDTAGNVYLAFHRPNGVQYVWSADAGETWSEPVVVSPPSLKSFVHVDAVAGDDGRLAIVYRATPDGDQGPDAIVGWAAWHLYVTFVENATTATPTIRTGIVNDPEDPVQRGPICTGGIGCFGGSRNLLDFIDIAVGPDGRVYPTYSDGCDQECETPADSRARLGPVGIQVEGPRLFVDRAPWAST